MIIRRIPPSRPDTAGWLFNCLISAVLAGCGGGDGNAESTGTATATGVGQPSITAQPASMTVTAGDAASFSVAASGADRIAYQWLRNGTPIEGATAATYTLAATSAADSGAGYSVVVTGSGGSVTSAAAILTVTTTGGSTATGGDAARCLTLAIPLGKTIEVTSKSTSKTVEDVSTTRVLESTLFKGKMTVAVESSTMAVGSSSKSVITDYYDPDMGAGSTTQYGEVVVQTSPDSVATTTTVYDPPAIIPALVLNQPVSVILNGTMTIERTFRGVVQPTTTQATGGKGDATLLGIESVTVPAGTFDACKIKTTWSPTSNVIAWLLVDYGVTLKEITTLGTTVETTVADSVLLDGKPLP